MEKANKTLQKDCIQPLLKWYRAHARDLPWRRTTDPYGIWVSEIMLQQTQVATVIPYWERWMKQLPTISALANAPIDHILKLWEGLGYYRRARLMQKAAIIIENEHEGTFPTDDDEILDLPGIGPYTAGAISSIAFDRPSPILDGNVIRVLTRYYSILDNPKSAPCLSRLWQLSQHWVIQADILNPRQEDNCSHLNQGMMELGANICLPNKQAKCEVCPIESNCQARKNANVGELPKLPQRRSIVQQHRLVVVLKHNGKFLIQRKMSADHNEGLSEFFNEPIEDKPNGKLSEQEAKTKLERVKIKCDGLKFLTTIKHTITHHRITLHCFTGKTPTKSLFNKTELQWLDKTQLNQVPMPSAHQKIRRKILEDS